MMIQTIYESSSCALQVGELVDAKRFDAVWRRMVLEYCKWDPQIGDVLTLADFPIYITASQWRWLAKCAEQLTTELFEAERRLLDAPELFAELNIPKRLRPIIADWRGHDLRSHARVMRFDFHPTAEGWKISEVNSDVPGGYCESTNFSRLMASECGAGTSGEPGEIWADAIANAIYGRGEVLLLSAVGFVEDLQIVSYMAERLRERGINAQVVTVDQLDTVDCIPIVRFFQAEWLGRARHKSLVPRLLGPKGGNVFNPGYAILSESKRFPLVWDRAGLGMSMWRSVLPETRSAREIDWQSDDRWLIKTSHCNTGDTISWRGKKKPWEWALTKLDVAMNPQNWIAQRRFESSAIDTPRGKMFPCLGVYTIGGKACGIYGRISPHSVVDYQAIDVAVLVKED